MAEITQRPAMDVPATTTVDAFRYIIERLDRTNALLEAILANTQTTANTAPIFQRTNRLLELLAAASLPASPRNTVAITVGTGEELLVENPAADLLQVEITNDGVAQPLWISGKGVLVAAGRVILPGATVRYILPRSAKLYGICAVATVPARVSISHDILAAVSQLY